MFSGETGIRVFITYSKDSKRHAERVADLADCLRRNKLQPSLDMFEKLFIAHDKYQWIDQRFREVRGVALCFLPCPAFLGRTRLYAGTA